MRPWAARTLAVLGGLAVAGAVAVTWFAVLDALAPNRVEVECQVTNVAGVFTTNTRELDAEPDELVRLWRPHPKGGWRLFMFQRSRIHACREQLDVTITIEEETP